jgi:undecaprenyl-diphosphatase
VLDDGPGEFLRDADRAVRRAVRPAAAQPVVHRIASAVSQLTGPGLAGAVAVGAAALVLARRRRQALVLVAGTAGAWLLSAALKVTFAVARPAHVPQPHHAITGYGFPSAHTFVAVVGCGLLAWAAARHTRPGMARVLHAGAAAAAALVGAARIIVGAHWLTDVVAGFALGVIWLNLVVWATARYEDG